MLWSLSHLLPDQIPHLAQVRRTVRAPAAAKGGKKGGGWGWG